MDPTRFGFQRIHIVLHHEGWKVNHDRVHRLYPLEGLQVRERMRRPKRLHLHRWPAPLPPKGLGERWSTHFVHDQLIDGRAIRILTVFDYWSRESVLLEVACQLTGGSVAGESADPPMLVASVDIVQPRRLDQIARA